MGAGKVVVRSVGLSGGAEEIADGPSVGGERGSSGQRQVFWPKHLERKWLPQEPHAA